MILQVSQVKSWINQSALLLYRPACLSARRSTLNTLTLNKMIADNPFYTIIVVPDLSTLLFIKLLSQHSPSRLRES